MRRVGSLISDFGLARSAVVLALAATLGLGVISGFGSAPTQTAAMVAAAKPHTVTYLVTGTRSWVNYGYWIIYGQQAKDLAQVGPLSVVIRAAHPYPWLHVSALTAKARVSCEILVDGRVVSRQTASGDYGQADCEQSPPTPKKPTPKKK